MTHEQALGDRIEELKDSQDRAYEREAVAAAECRAWRAWYKKTHGGECPPELMQAVLDSDNIATVQVEKFRAGVPQTPAMVSFCTLYPADS